MHLSMLSLRGGEWEDYPGDYLDSFENLVSQNLLD